jgi:hypothetical protein
MTTWAAYARYQRLMTFDEGDASLLRLPADRSPLALGKLAGWAAAGDARAADAVDELTGRKRELVHHLVTALQKVRPGPAVEILQLAANPRAERAGLE